MISLRLRDRWALLNHNWLLGRFYSWQMRRILFPQWIAEGRNPARFPRFARVSLSDLDWAAEMAKGISGDEKRRPLGDFIAEQPAKV